jgi:hypothetical protein
MDQDAPRQHAERALDDAHVLVQHQMMDIGAVEQRADSGNQHDIVGPNQFPQSHILLCRWQRAGGDCQPLPALAASRGTFYCISKDSANSAKVETSVAVIVPFESPSNASIEPLVGLVAADMERVNATILSRTGSKSP